MIVMDCPIVVIAFSNKCCELSNYCNELPCSCNEMNVLRNEPNMTRYVVTSNKVLCDLTR